MRESKLPESERLIKQVGLVIVVGSGVENIQTNTCVVDDDFSCVCVCVSVCVCVCVCVCMCVY